MTSVAVGYWKNLNLKGLQKELDVTAADLANRQDESETSRRRLVDLSRDFKQNASEEVKKVAAPILKSFQLEIDALSKRSKAGEAAFLDVYKKVIDMPDPTVLLSELERKAAKASELELECQNLRETLEQYNAEFAEVKNQEVTIRQLHEKVKAYEEQSEAEVEAKVKEKEDTMKQYYEERERQLDEARAITSAKLQDSEKQIATLEKALSQAQSELLDARSISEEQTMVRSSEVDMTLDDLERATQRAEIAERECELLRDQLQGLQDATDVKADEAVHSSALELEISAKDKQISQLLGDLRQMQLKLAAVETENDKKVVTLREELDEKDLKINTLEDSLRQRGDYEETKRELNVLKSVEFGMSSPSENNTSNGSDGRSKPLEILLLEKNKALEGQNTALRLSQQKTQEELSEIKDDHVTALKRCSDQADLIRRLEHDLLRVNPENEFTGAPQDPTSDITGALLATADGTNLESPGSAKDQLLAIIASQRDRLKERVQEHEESLMLSQDTNSQLESEIEKIRNDNVKLYEKIKFLQSYSAKKTDHLHRDDTVDRYSSQYEASLDPFQKFHQQENQRRYNDLRPHERVTLGIGRMIMSSPTARAFFFFYLLFLHCLIFFVLYRMAYMETCKRDNAAECFQKFQEHMQSVHGLSHSPLNNG